MKKYLEILQTKKKLIVILIMAILLISIIAILVVNKNYKKDNSYASTTDSDKFREEYESLNKEQTIDNKEYPKMNIASNNIKYLTIEESLNILNDGTAVIYIGYAECLYCRSAVQVLVDTAKDMDLESIYYLDISEIWDIKEVDENGKIITNVEANEHYGKLLEQLEDEHLENYILIDENGKEIDTKEKRVKVPLVLFIVDGQIVSYWAGTLFSQEDPYESLNEDQIKGLSEIYQYGIRDVLEGLENK